MPLRGLVTRRAHIFGIQSVPSRTSGKDALTRFAEETAMDPSQQIRFIDDVVAAAYRLQEADMLGEAFGALPSGAPGPSPAEVAVARQQAEALVQHPSFREQICPALRSASDDVGEIAKLATPILLTASLGLQAPISLGVLGCAAVAFVIARAGVAAICPKAAQA